MKIANEFDLAGLRLAVVGRWPLFRGGRYAEGCMKKISGSKLQLT